ncbi:3-hydroxyisobutyryl-CoA hydrolase, mitochondrial [Galdieria sulphuraria]|uniref:3-hydroxyisobutyryl-CoA hydrolase n=1 Tax=Galdieria sulphuraria TaxID=130081 RepID=M2X298_GALSU|nr:3-hydroxyisobutyryl-CoA hydrolase [Galdieria sulphuraria]EME30500.1 3-hydroxyisobutyryl-CoA hydrolase [Galdieria sulphuraria]GJD06354.1 3-hydroxyisobutyryl-CoA hydrolase, mitochondrial [Galdieria sulphuraria]|eukprot:XP_005707020.1 3-hydroxyisobutyryl-CoA hydrolase [Galdieria sulphuraria]
MTSSVSLEYTSGGIPINEQGLPDPSIPQEQAELLEFGSTGGVKTLLLHRPKALNALSTSLCTRLRERVRRYEQSGLVNTILLKGAGGKAFCAGGDVRGLYDARGDRKSQEKFFREEYSADYILGTLRGITSVAIWDGICMGGGAGISIHGPIRIATERTIFAMPECGIGLHPDVGVSYFLAKLPNHIGMYLALTGARVTGRDVYHAGIATHYVPSHRLSDMLRCLEESDTSSLHAVNSIIGDFEGQPMDGEETSEFVKQWPVINRCFAWKRVEEVIQALKKEATETQNQFAEEALQLILKASPTSLKVTLESIEQASQMTLKQTLQKDFRMSMHFMKGHDFYEGIRATLVDKDRNPKWQPNKLEQVTRATVEEYFKPLGKEIPDLQLEDRKWIG